MTLNHHRGGRGEPLLLLHGIGHQWQGFAPVLPALEAEREVVAADLPGFGASAPLPAGVEPHPERLADAVEAFLDELGWDSPHVAGSSLGGWIALILSRRGRARTAVALSPAGFWNRWEHAYSTLMLRLTRAGAGPLAEHQRSVVVRTLGGGLMTARPWRMDGDAAVAGTHALADAPGFSATLDAMSHAHFTGGADVPVTATVAWGTKDRLLLPRQAERARRALPRARHVPLPGCGHLPMSDDPDLVAKVILAA